MTTMTEARLAEIRARVEALLNIGTNAEDAFADRRDLLTALDSERAKVAEVVKALWSMLEAADELGVEHGRDNGPCDKRSAAMLGGDAAAAAAQCTCRARMLDDAVKVARAVLSRARQP